MARSLAAAGAALLLSTFAVQPLGAATPPLTLRIAPGQTVRDALHAAQLRDRLSGLKAGAAGQTGAPGRASGPLALTAGEIVSGTITVGRATPLPSMKISYKAGPAGFAIASFTFTSPAGTVTFDPYYSDLKRSRHGTVTFDTPVTAQYYVQPGQWALTSAYVADYAGNYVSYDQTQLARIFANPYLTFVNNGPVDITPPVVTAGQVLTPTVSLSSPDPTFEATLTGSDNLSGIAAAYVIVEAPGGSFGQTNYVPVPIPVLSGTVHAYASIFASQPTGTWSITGYELCDIAGNCLTDTNAADVQSLFGTSTFTVTN